MLLYVNASVLEFVTHLGDKFADRAEHLLQGLSVYKFGGQYHTVVLSGGDIDGYSVFALDSPCYLMNVGGSEAQVSVCPSGVF